MLTTLQALAHAPMGRIELAILTGQTVDQVERELAGLKSLPVGLVEDEAGVWSITELGRFTVQTIEAYESGRRRDAECQGSSSARGRSAAGEGR